MTADKKESEFLNVLEVAGRLRVTPRTIHEFIGRGELVAVDIGRGATRPRWRISQSDFVNFVSRRKKTSR